jgi:hypothetical protein
MRAFEQDLTAQVGQADAETLAAEDRVRGLSFIEDWCIRMAA